MKKLILKLMLLATIVIMMSSCTHDNDVNVVMSKSLIGTWEHRTEYLYDSNGNEIKRQFYPNEKGCETNSFIFEKNDVFSDISFVKDHHGECKKIFISGKWTLHKENIIFDFQNDAAVVTEKEEYKITTLNPYSLVMEKEISLKDREKADNLDAVKLVVTYRKKE